MPLSLTRLSLSVLFVAALSVTALAETLFEDFSTMPTGRCIEDGEGFGAWQFVYDGYGCTSFVAPFANTMLLEQPLVSTLAGETHGSLVLGPAASGDLALEVSTVTTRQLRSGDAPNPWEVGWILWNYTDDFHFYYFIAKPNGWELGKEDPAYPGAQRFLATGSSPSFPIGSWHRVRIVQVAATMQVFVNDQLITTFTDAERPYTAGRVGLYSEDAEVYFDDVSLSTTTRTKGKKRR